jgi:hypothetical protein
LALFVEEVNQAVNEELIPIALYMMDCKAPMYDQEILYHAGSTIA